MKRSLWGVTALCALSVWAGTAWADEGAPTGPPPVFDSEPPVVVIDDVTPPAEVVLPNRPVDGWWMPAQVATAPQRLRRRATPPWRLNVQGGFSLLVDEPEGTLGGPPTGLPALSWDNNDYTPEIGARLTLARSLDRCSEVEVRGTYYGGWNDSNRQTGAFGFANVFGQSPSATTTLESSADLVSIEANYWRDVQNCGPRLRWGAGLRYINFEESAEARNWAGLAPDSFLNGEATNEFFGGQVLGSAMWQTSDRIDLELSGRAFFGAMGRDILIDEVSILSGGRKRAVNEDSDFGWGIEIGLDASFRISNCLSLTAGYSLLYLDEVTRAHDALDFSQGVTGAVQAQQVTDNIWVHSLWLGLEFRW